MSRFSNMGIFGHNFALIVTGFVLALRNEYLNYILATNGPICQENKNFLNFFDSASREPWLSRNRKGQNFSRA